uniref:Uncharacterized protein n=1 Tax=Cyclophora tenuis TaxID=216820 RepID=A0A7S1D9M0_CYCTE
MNKANSQCLQQRIAAFLASNKSARSVCNMNSFRGFCHGHGECLLSAASNRRQFLVKLLYLGGKKFGCLIKGWRCGKVAVYTEALTSSRLSCTHTFLEILFSLFLNLRFAVASVC